VPLWSAAVSANRVFLVVPLATIDVKPLVPETWMS